MGRPHPGPAFSFLNRRSIAMTVHLIDMLLGGCLDAELDLQLASILPMTLRRVQLTNAYAPDYRIDAGGLVNLGYGWSKVASKSGIPYVSIIIEHPIGRQISGVAWEAPDQAGRWHAQFQSLVTVTLHS
jgi:uncharacterized protein (DUF736 family)